MSVETTIHRGRSARPGLPSRSIRLKARLFGYRLDRDLACGVPSWQTSLHAARGLQITSRRQCRATAKGLERVTESDRRVGPGAF
jgi:hypothetical protein